MGAWGLLSLLAPPCAQQPWPHPPLKCVPQRSATTLGQAGLSTDKSRDGPGPVLTFFTGVHSELSTVVLIHQTVCFRNKGLCDVATDVPLRKRPSNEMST